MARCTGARHGEDRHPGDHRTTRRQLQRLEQLAKSRGIAVQHAHVGKARAQQTVKHVVALDHDQLFGRDAAVEERLGDDAGAAPELDHRPPAARGTARAIAAGEVAAADGEVADAQGLLEPELEEGAGIRWAFAGSVCLLIIGVAGEEVRQRRRCRRRDPTTGVACNPKVTKYQP